MQTRESIYPREQPALKKRRTPMARATQAPPLQHPVAQAVQLSAVAQRRPPRPQRYSPWRRFRAFVYDLLRLMRESRFALIGFLALVGLSAGYLLFDPAGGFNRICSSSTPWSCLAPALYETLKLLTFQSVLKLPADTLGKVLFFAMPILGLGLIIQGVGAVGRQAFNKSGRLEAWQIALASTFRGHVVVCGLGRIGWRVTRRLIANGCKVVVIEREWASEFVPSALTLRVPVILGDARDAAVLRRAGVERASAVIADIDDDLLDIEIALAARALQPGVRVVLRSFYDNLDRALNTAHNFGPNSAFSSSALGAPTFAAAAVSRDIAGVVPLGDELYGVSVLVIQPDSRLSGALREIEQAYDLRIVRRMAVNGKALRYEASGVAQVGERLTVLGHLSALERARLATLADAPGQNYPTSLQHPTTTRDPIRDTIIVCGLGKVGFRVVTWLYERELRPRIVVIQQEHTRSAFMDRLGLLEGVSVVAGDMRDEDTLKKAGIERAYAVAALTSDDVTNLQAGLAAQRLWPDVHIVLRVFSDALAENLEAMFGVNAAYSNSKLTGATMAATSLVTGARYGVELGDTLFGAVDITVQPGDRCAGKTVEFLRAHHEALVMSLVRQGAQTSFPTPDMIIQPGDALTVLAPIEDLLRLAR